MIFHFPWRRLILIKLNKIPNIATGLHGVFDNPRCNYKFFFVI